MSHVRCCLALATGWTLQYIDDLEWPDVIEFNEYFAEHPPTHVAVEDLVHAMGFKRVKKQREVAPSDINAQLPGGGDAQHFDQLPPTVQQWLSSMSENNARV